MSDPRPYHHGDLAAALLMAAEAELAERGVEGFSLRQVARRAGVSHAAPAHHFGDAQGLLTALATEGFRQFLAAQGERERVAPGDPRSQLMAAGLGYVDFAMARPALFRLIFGSDKPDHDRADLTRAATDAYQHLEAQVAAMGRGQQDMLGIWAMAHGLADLLSAGRMKALSGLPADRRDPIILALFARYLDAEPDGA